jgi:hypothetical protein
VTADHHRLAALDHAHLGLGHVAAGGLGGQAERGLLSEEAGWRGRHRHAAHRLPPAEIGDGGDDGE